MTAPITIREVDWGELAHTRPQPRVFMDALSLPGAPDGGRPWPTVAIAVAGEQVVGIVHGHRAGIGEQASEDSYSRPYDQLERSAMSTWFITGLAVDRDWKQQAIERQLLSYADSIAARGGLGGLSLILGSFATELVDLVQAEGFTRRGEAEGAYAIGVGVTWVLLVRETVH